MSAADDPSGASRYYANPAEQKILIAGLQRYFSLPERSQNRNRIAKEVSQYLRYFSPHWSPRAVRLWFNNNKHTYFETDGEPPPIDPPPPPPPVRASASAPLLPKPPAPAVDSASLLLPPIQAPNPKVHFADRPAPFPSLAAVAPPLFQPLEPISFWPQPRIAESPPDRSYSSLSHLLAQIKSTAERDPKYPSLVEQFDSDCSNLLARLGEIKADRVDPIARFARIPTRREPSQLDFPSLDPLPESLSASDILDFPVRSLSFGSTADHSIWQARAYTDANVAAFESATLTPSFAAIAYVPFAGTQRTLAVTRYADTTATWVAHVLPIRNAVESMAADAHFAYLLTADRIFLVPLTRDGRAESAVVPPSPSGRVIAPFMEGAVAAFDGSSQLIYVTAALTVRPIETQFRGVLSIAPIDGRLLCGVAGSAVVRLLAPDGREARGFVGHVAPVTRVARLSDQLFASTGEDGTVRVWDIRERFPVVSVATNGVAVVNVAGSSEYLIAGMHSRGINVFDLRSRAGRPVLVVATQEYDPSSLHYNQNEDMLAMFGAEMCGDGDGQSRQGIFRIYREFVGLDTR